MMIYYLEKCLSFFCCLLPESVCEALGQALGALTWPLVPKKRRKMAKDNVQQCLGVSEKEAERIAKASWVRFGPMAFEVMRFPILKGRLFGERVEYEGLDAVKACVAEGRGFIISTSHCGNWELLGGALAEAGLPTVGVGMRQKDSGSDRFITEYRSLIGMHVAYKNDVRELYRLAKSGWGVGLLMDQDVSIRDGVIIDWFGQPTNFAQGPATIGRSLNIPIFPIFITRLSPGRHKAIIHPPILVAHTGDKKADILEATVETGRVLEEHIRAHPEEWFWLHDRWKSVREIRQDGDDWAAAHDRWHSAEQMTRREKNRD